MKNVFAFLRWHFSKAPTFLKGAANQLSGRKLGDPTHWDTDPKERSECVIDSQVGGKLLPLLSTHYSVIEEEVE